MFFFYSNITRQSYNIIVYKNNNDYVLLIFDFSKDFVNLYYPTIIIYEIYSIKFEKKI
jgi:hypothetical protein